MLLLDEPFDGVDPLGVEATMEVIADARAGGAAVLVSTHLRDLAVQACQHALVLRGGSAVAAVGAAEMAGRTGRVPTAPSSTDAPVAGPSPGRRAAAARRARSASGSPGCAAVRRRAAPVASRWLASLTLLAAVVPAFVAGRARG